MKIANLGHPPGQGGGLSPGLFRVGASTARRWVAALALPLLLVGAGGAWAQVAVTAVKFSPTHMGIGQDTIVTVDWSHSGTGPGAFTVDIPGAFDFKSASAICSEGSGTISCAPQAGAIGAAGSTQFVLTAKSIGTANLTAVATGSSQGNATATYYINASGKVSILKSKTSPTDDPIAGQPIEFTLKPQIEAGGESVPAGATIVVTDNLPGTAAEFQYISHSPSGITPLPSCAPTGHQLVCTYTAPAGGWTPAQVNAAQIIVKGRALIEGDFLKNEAVVDVDPIKGYVDLTLADNTAIVPLKIKKGGDLQALGTFPTGSLITGTTHSLTISYKNNGPLKATGDGQVSTILPTDFTVDGSLPAGCVQAAGTDTIDGVSGTRIDCTATDVPSGDTRQFVIPVKLPAVAPTPNAGKFPVQITPPTGFNDHDPSNNLEGPTYTITIPYADLSLTKSKSLSGPQLPDTSVVNTFTIKNSGGEKLNYTTTAPISVVDFLRPEEIKDNNVTFVTTGWSCAVSDKSDPVDANRTKRVVCKTIDNGALAVGSTLQLQFTTQLTLNPGAAPVPLVNRACTGGTALILQDLAGTVGPQPADTAAGNDCATAGGGSNPLYVTHLQPTAAIKKFVSVDGTDPSNDAQTANDAPTWTKDSAHPLKWKMVITTAGSDNIKTLVMKDTLPGRLANGTYHNQTGITYTASNSGTCTLNDASITCIFTDVPAGATRTVTVDMQRPVSASSGGHENKAIISSPDSQLTATAGGVLSDPAWVKVEPRYDPAVSSKTISKARPSIGEAVNFTLNIRNEGYEKLPVGSFTVTDAINTDASQNQAAFELTGTPSGTGFDCSATNLVTGEVSCTNTQELAVGNTVAITIPVRVKKPTSVTLNPVGNSYLWSGSDTVLDQINIARVTLNPALCEWREKTSVSTSCNDANAKSNNAQNAKFAIKVPDFDVQAKIEREHTTPVGLRDTLRYRLTMRNDGPSLAESTSIIAYLETPTGYTLEPVLTGGAGTPIKVNDINSVAAQAGFTLRTTAAADISCELEDATPTPPAPPAVVCSWAGAAGTYLDNKKALNFALDFTLKPPPGGVAGPVRVGVPMIVCAANEIDGHERNGRCGASERSSNGFDPADANNATLYGNNYEKVNDIIFPETDLLIEKSTVTTSPVNVGQTVQYRLVAGNKGADTPSRIRIIDTLPAGFEWTDTASVGVSATGSATVSAASLAVSAAVPAADAQNVCWVSNGVTTVNAGTDQQQITCALEGSFPPGTLGTENTVVLTLHARAKALVYAGPYANTDADNAAQVIPGFEDNGTTPVSLDKVAANNQTTSPVQVVRSSLAGYVYHDSNNDGSRSGEVGIAGVTVTLTGTDSYGNAVSTSRVTDGSGAYLFDNLAPGTYTVTETHPTNWVDGKDTVGQFSTGGGAPGAGSGTAGGDVIKSIALPANTAGTEYNFGELKQLTGGSTVASIAGYVYHDANKNGTKDAGESGIAGVTVTLTGANGDTRQTTTDSSGFYKFEGLEPGVNYTLNEVQPSGWADGQESKGTVHTQVSAGNDNFVVTPVSGGNGEDWNFGEFTPAPRPPTPSTASVSGMVYHDRNDNGVPEVGEEGIPGVTIILRDSNGQEVARTTTDANGNYSFTNLNPGIYRITEIQPTGWKDGKERLGSHGGSAGNDEFTGISLKGGDVGVNYDFGELKSDKASICGKVYHDRNDDGKPDAGEEGIANVSIELLDASGKVVKTIQTDASGTYCFEELEPGTYSVREQQPPGWSDGKDNAPGDKGGSTGADRFTGIVLKGGDEAKNYNFGEINPKAGLVVVKTLYEGWDAGASCGTPKAVKELLIVEKNPTEHSLTWCFSVTNRGDKFLSQPVWADSAYPGMVATPKAGTALPLAPGATGIWYFQAKEKRSVVNIVGVKMSVTDDNGKPIPGLPPASSSDDGKATFGMIYDPPYGVKVGSVEGAEIINWTMVWVNDNVIAANNVYVSDTVKAPMEFVPGTLSCVGEGVTTVVAGTCGYTPATKTISVRANFGADLGKTVANAENRLFISFHVKVPKTAGAATYENQGKASWTPPGSTDPVDGVTTFVPGVKIDPIDPADPKVPVVTPPPGVDPKDPSIGRPDPGKPGTPPETPVKVDPAGKGFIGCSVFDDTNKNGVRDAGEAGISGVTIELLDGNGQVVATTVTALDGSYSFPGLTPGSYKVRKILPAGFAPTSPTEYVLTVVAGQNASACFGVSSDDPSTATIGSRESCGVFNDRNGNGVRDAGETGIAGIRVELLDMADVLLAITVTDANGSYFFGGLRGGSYKVQAIVPQVGGGSTTLVRTVTLAPGASTSPCFGVQADPSTPGGPPKPVSIPTLSEWGLILLSLLLGALVLRHNASLYRRR